MRNILKHMSRIPESEFARPKLLLLDYDGTLVPIAGTPRRARLGAAKRMELKRIAATRGLKTGIITGRSLKDIRHIVGIENILYSANHGFEVYYRGRIHYPCGRGFKGPMDLLGKKINSNLGHIPNIIIESKGFSVAVHFRLVPRKYWSEIEKTVRRVSAPWRDRHGWRLTGGKRLIEIRPVLHWNKGDVALWIWGKFARGAVPWYFGDDVTDEDAFRSLSRKSVTVAVGRRTRSGAKYFADNVAQVWQTLKCIERKHKKKGG